ncbi:MAG TPA: lysylphosphatidylglycerol synthase domain-containing protein, partial [Kiritimatiellia bacterium]|nr:lysylphosphatidylglycerol synthase domain-containing protein [Kiritimatiellia bacterium]
LKTWSNLFIIRALGLAIPSLTMWMVIPLFGVVSALPISIGGLGVRELTAQAVSGPLGLDNTHLVALSLAGHALVTAVSMLGAIPLLTRRRNAGGARDQAMRC